MNIGTKEVIGAYIGSQKVYKMYAGNNLVYTGILDTPQNLSIDAGEVSFDAVEGASSYDVLSNDILRGTTNSNQFNIDTLSDYSSIPSGQQRLTIKADSDIYRKSNASSPIVYHKLSYVYGEGILDDNYSFWTVSNADSYSIYADDGLGSTILLGVWTMPSKGDIISMNVDGSNKQFRVLKVDGSNVEVVMMTNASDTQVFDTSSQVYAGSALDIYLNSTWYETLTPTAKTAIVDKTFTQDSWYSDNSGNPDYSGYCGTTKPGTSFYTISLGSATFGSSITRHVYALSVQDVLDYVRDRNITDGQLQNYNLWKMFWNDEVTHTGYGGSLRLRSAASYNSTYTFYIDGNRGSIGGVARYWTFGARPAFQIDLTKIPFTIVS